MATKANIGAKIVLEGEKEYRQSIASVSKSMSVLKSDLRAVSAEFDGNANSLDALKAKNEIYIKQQSEQEKKLALLRGALDSVSKEYGENSKQAQDWQIKLNNAYSELNKINGELNQNQKYMKEAEKSTDKTAKSIDEFGKEIKNTKEETLKFGDVLKANLAGEAIVRGIEAMGRAIKEVAKATVDVVKDTAAYADNIMTLSAQTGIATDTLQELNYMAELTDVSLDTVTKTMARNIRSMASAKEGTKLYTDAYKALKVDAIDPVTGALRDSETVYWEVLDALGRMASETERDAISMQLFGRSAQELNPLIKIGKDGMAEFSKEAREMGSVLSGDTLKGLGETDDALQRLVQQFEISKRKVAIEMAPAMTEAIGKISEKVDDVDDKFADFAGGALTDTVDAFIWLVDHSNLITSGLKGIAAAIITKKAADGVTYAIQAYKTLTTATQTATAAQIAFNTASKASVIGAIASAVVGLGAALISYSSNADDAAREISELEKETKKLYDTTKALSEEVKKNASEREKETNDLTNKYEVVKKLTDSLYDLADKETKSNAEKSQMLALVKQINEEMPGLNLSFDEYTGALNKQEGEVQNLIEAELELQRVRFAGEKMAQIEWDRIESEEALNALLAKRSPLYKDMVEAEKEYTRLTKESGLFSSKKTAVDEIAAKLNFKATAKLYQDNKDLINSTSEDLKALDVEYAKSMDFMKGRALAVGDVASSMDLFGSKYKEVLEAQTESEIKTFEERIDLIENFYDKAEDALEEKLKAEEDAIEESQEKQTKILEDAKKKELKVLEKDHKKKLELIDEEYVESLKNTNEDKYNAIKKIQDEIDGIDTKQEAEDRALELVEEARERGEIQARIDNAKTAEEKLEAQEDLVEFDKKVAREILKTERDLQKDILKEQKDTVEATAKAEIESIENIKKEKEEAAAEEKKTNTDSIDEYYKAELESLAKTQKKEKESFAKRQEYYKEYLKEQKTLASRNAQAIYEDDLAQYKLNQALKYDQAVNDERSMKKIIQDYAYNSMDPGKDRDAILRTNSLDEMLKYYNPSALLKTATPSQTQGDLNYDLFGKAVKDALKGVKIELNGKTVGALVETTVNNMLR